MLTYKGPYIPRTKTEVIRDAVTKDKNFSNQINSTMGRFILWLRNPNIPSWKKTVAKFSFIGLAVLSTPFVGIYLIYQFIKVTANLDSVLKEGLAEENRNLKLNQQDKDLIDAITGPFQIPEVAKIPTTGTFKAIFTQLKSPIIRCGDIYLALLVRDKKTKEERLITITKSSTGWNLSGLPGNSLIMFQSDDPQEQAKMKEIENAAKFADSLKRLKKILKGTSSLYEPYELALALLPKVDQNVKLGGPSITEAANDTQVQMIITALGGAEKCKQIPVVQEKPWKKREIFHKIKMPFFQYQGKYLAFLMKNRITQEQKTVVLKKDTENHWFFTKPIETIDIDQKTRLCTVEIHNAEGVAIRRTYPNKVNLELPLEQVQDQVFARNLKINLDTLQEIVAGKDNLYMLENKF